MLYRLVTLIHKEILQISRDWLLIGVLVLGPALQLSLLAWNTGRGITNLPLLVVDQDNSAASRSLIVALDNTKELYLSGYAVSIEELTRRVDASEAEVGVIIPPGFARDLPARARAPQIHIVASGANNIAGRVGMAAAERAIASSIAQQLAPAGSATPAIDLRVDARYNPALNTRHYTIPAMIGLIVFELSLVLASLGLTRERETGTLEQLLIMPFQRIEIVIGKAVAPLVITLADFALMLVIAMQVFGTPMRGSFALLFGLTTLFMLAEIGWGLLISTVARTQQQAVLLVFVQAIFDMTFSGFLAPTENLPPALNIVSNFIPLRHYLTIIRGIMLKGTTLETLTPEALALASLTLAIGAIVMLNLGRRID